MLRNEAVGADQAMATNADPQDKPSAGGLPTRAVCALHCAWRSTATRTANVILRATGNFYPSGPGALRDALRTGR